ncbi:Uma2 family endonuclease [Nocardiopsis sp. RSe5-2]|uniref:Uma2 family endonuclease n=1 Tax=Nocardiopsis endophytica TaxID=3018445 RepID=A0ABT4U5F3_9ACTN|nr:Uma2 family endonuclease [Nocardiopsis endophytica]MDA2812171.1 Uma2 family endonuclease [Nocardiopsis endophytica]
MKVTELLDQHDIRYEFIDGEVIIPPSPGQLHQEIQLDILLQARHNGHPAAMSAPVRFSGSNDDPRPDVAVFEEGTRLPASGMRPGAQVLLVVEVVSPSSRIRDEKAKKELYARLGVPCYLIVRQSGDPWILYSAPEQEEYRETSEGAMGDYVNVPALPWPVRTPAPDDHMRDGLPTAFR